MGQRRSWKLPEMSAELCVGVYFFGQITSLAFIRRSHEHPHKVAPPFTSVSDTPVLGGPPTSWAAWAWGILAGQVGVQLSCRPTGGTHTSGATSAQGH